MEVTYQLAVILGTLTLACWLAAGLTALVGSAHDTFVPDATVGKIALGLNFLGTVSALALAALMLLPVH